MSDRTLIFDTDVISELIREKPEAIAFVNRTDPRCMFTTVISEAELLGPRYRNMLTAANYIELTAAQLHLSVTCDVLANAFAGIFPMDLVAAHRYVDLKQVQKLSKIGNADLLIAAIALRHQAALVTGNADHFRKVPGLEVEDFRRR
jgi:tRNA(fMet)-specific endonuclease VapC